MAEISSMHIECIIDKDDFNAAGEASSRVKKSLNMLGIPPKTIKRIAVAMYEAEINAFIHGGGGKAVADIYPDRVEVLISDEGKGIADLELAMQEGYSTAGEEVLNLGFGAGMGLPNMKRSSDEMHIDTSIGVGTTVTMTIYIRTI